MLKAGDVFRDTVVISGEYFNLNREAVELGALNALAKAQHLKTGSLLLTIFIGFQQRRMNSNFSMLFTGCQNKVCSQ